MNLIKKLFYPFQKYEYSIPLNKEDFYNHLQKADFNSETNDNHFTIRNKWSPFIKNSFYFTGRGDIYSSSGKTEFQVIFNINIPGMIFLCAFFLIFISMGISNLVNDISNHLDISTDIMLIIIPFFFYLLANIIGQALIKKFNDFIKSLNGEIFEYTKEIQNDK